VFRPRKEFAIPLCLLGLALPGVAASRDSTERGLSFSGHGARALRPFRVIVDSTLSWRNSGSIFATTSRAPTRTLYGSVHSDKHAGTSFLPRGRYVLNVIARGKWTLAIRPGVQHVRHQGKALVFAGNGREALPPFKVRRDSLLQWRQSGGLFQLFNTLSSAGAVTTNDRFGNSYLPRGSYRFIVASSAGAWSFRVVPER
jgi:hypothetical protein